MDPLVAEPVAGGPSRSSLKRPRSRARPTQRAIKSVTGSHTGSEGVTDDSSEHRCFYKEHLVATKQNINEQRDYFLMEHLNKGHLTPCKPLSASTADAMVLTAPIKEELPSNQVRCLEPVDIRQKLLSPRHIRLLKLSPRTFSYGNRHVRKNSALRCEVYQASLDDLTTDGPPLFAAASYVCGDQTHAKRIQCGRKTIGIPQNVYDVLRYIRFESRPRLVWIDYLCINQCDAREKSHQVRLLHKIYAQAHVVSWLGTGSGLNLSLVVFYLSVSARLWTEAVRADPTQHQRRWLFDGPVEHLESYIDSQARVRPHQRALHAISSIGSATYFQRVWIMQEFLLGKTNTCQIGDTLHSVAVLAAAAQVLPHLFGPDGRNADFSMASSWYFRPALDNQWPLAFVSDAKLQDLDVVTRASGQSCSDPRDYIYGVTSLFKDPDTYIVDYTLSDAEVFADFTVHCLSIEGNISVLDTKRLPMYAGDAPINLKSDLPTWCPDWSVNEGRPLRHFDRYDQAKYMWKADGGAKPKLVYSRPSRISLALTGITISTLELCSGSTFGWRRADAGLQSSVWVQHDVSLSYFLKLQGLQVGFNPKDVILGIFARVFHLADSSIDDRTDISNELRLLLDRANQSDLISLLTPLFLAEADPELFEMVGFEIDERIPREDYAIIVREVSQIIHGSSEGTRLFFTEHGMMGTGYPGAKEGDLVCIIYGSATPQILRRADKEGEYMLIGSCNVDGLMFGEGLEMGLPEQEFVLV